MAKEQGNSRIQNKHITWPEVFKICGQNRSVHDQFMQWVTIYRLGAFLNTSFNSKEEALWASFIREVFLMSEESTPIFKIHPRDPTQ